jgi:predicted nucleotidyltransferase
MAKSFGFQRLLSSRSRRTADEDLSRQPNAARATSNSAVAPLSLLSEYITVTVTELPIEIDYNQIADFCRERGIQRLSLFGSVLREDFDPQHSDVDVLAEFEPGVLKTVGFKYFGYGNELAAIIGRKVDFCSRLHPLILDRVRDELVPIYEGA